MVAFNVKKTQLLGISRKTVKDNCVVRFLDEVLKTQDSIKLLGINVSKTFEWNTHVTKVAKRAGQHLGILHKAKRLLNADGLATLYKTRVRSVMEYCGPIWQNASKTS